MILLYPARFASYHSHVSSKTIQYYSALSCLFCFMLFTCKFEYHSVFFCLILTFLYREYVSLNSTESLLYQRNSFSDILARANPIKAKSKLKGLVQTPFPSHIWLPASANPWPFIRQSVDIDKDYNSTLGTWMSW